MPPERAFLVRVAFQEKSNGRISALEATSSGVRTLAQYDCERVCTSLAKIANNVKLNIVRSTGEG